MNNKDYTAILNLINFALHCFISKEAKNWNSKEPFKSEGFKLYILNEASPYCFNLVGKQGEYLYRSVAVNLANGFEEMGKAIRWHIELNSCVKGCTNV